MLPQLTEQYLAKKLLGAGAMGEVYLVENLAANRLEALKVLKKIDNEDERRVAQARFRREVRAGHRLAHQNIVPTYDAGVLPDGRLYLTMEYVEGPSLSALLHARGPLPIAMTLGVLAEIADALHHAHLAGVVHRDLKPHNLMLADHPDGKIIKMLDFGMAKILFGDVLESMILSGTGAVFGTPQYMSPEQCQGKPPDPRSDIYAVGCIAFELLVGEPPFKGMIAPLFAAHIKKPPRVPSQVEPDAGIPKLLDEIVMTCLQKPAELRFQNGAALCRAVQSLPGYRPLREGQARAATAQPAS
ncbi:MAG TPA: serine/threonine-protein kinase [Kofleriaceae bacterium]|nr:serine/threonine-protein kinase [Kofleriaceae bacterium]